MLTLVLIHIGDSLPSFFWDTVGHNRKYWSGPIHLIISASYRADPNVAKYNCTVVPYEEISSDALRELEHFEVLKKYGLNNFWHVTTRRLFVLEAYMRSQGLKHVIHCENDVLIYRDLCELETTLVRLYKETIAVNPLGPRHCTAGFSYIDGADPLAKVTDRMLSLLSLAQNGPKKLGVDMINEMIMLDVIQSESPKLVQNLPILPHTRHSLFLERFNSLFDSGSWGQYAGGTANGHKPGIAFKHHWIGTELLEKNYDLVWIKESNGLYCPYVWAKKGPPGIWKLNNLHIHSKRINEFTGMHIPIFHTARLRLFNRAAPSLKPISIGSEQSVLDDPFCKSAQFLAEYIHGDRFVALADYAITELESPIPNGLESEDCVIFCKTDCLERLFESIKTSNHKYILITHNSDRGIDSVLYNKKPPCIRQWFAQNVLVEKPELFPIPIGLERPGIARSGDPTILMELAITAPKKAKLAYMNQRDQTNPAIRVAIRETFGTAKFVTNGKNISYQSYMKEMANHHYVFSPPGNGFDCHRTWEALYAGVFPIVKSNPGMIAFKELPMLLVEDFGAVTKDLLTENLETLGMKRRNQRMLTMSYWKHEIEIARKGL